MNTATMERTKEHVVVTVQYVNQPKGNAVSGSIKDMNGDYYGVHKSKLDLFVPGMPYEFDFSVSEAGYRNVDVKTIQPVAAQRQAPLSTDPTNYPSRNAPPRAQAQNARPAPVQRSAPIEPPHQKPPRQPQNGNGGQFYRPTSPKDARRMFICSQMNALITSHQVRPNADDIAAAIAMLSDAYDMTLGQEDQS